MQKVLAFVCMICPLCIGRRQWPQSLYAKILRKIERHCPFCRAYDKIHKI